MAKKALCTYGGWKGHTPKKSMKIMEKLLLKEGFEVDFKDTMEPFADTDYMESLDLIVTCWTMSEIAEEQEKGLINAVMDGVGLCGWHGGLCDSFRNNVEYQFCVGGQWVAHPGGIMDYTVDLVEEKKDDPIIAGLTGFKIKSEQYYMHVDPANEVIATTTFHSLAMPWIEGVKIPVAWKKRWGDGKVFYVSYGHTNKDFEIPQALEIFRRGMLWAAEKEELE